MPALRGQFRRLSGGRAEVMNRLAPNGPVYQAGTLSGNPVAVAAGLASLRAADADVYAALDRNAERLGALRECIKVRR